MPDDERPGYWPGSESSSSGGHITPEPTGSIYDPLTEPTTNDPGSSARPYAFEIPAREEQDQPQRREIRRRTGARRVRRTLRHLDPLSVLKLSFFFYAVFLVIWLLVVAILYGMLDSMGVFNAIEDFSEAFAFNWQNQITLLLVERWALLIGLTIAVIGSIVNVLIAFLYNLAADMIGGLEMTFVERDL